MADRRRRTTGRKHADRRRRTTGRTHSDRRRIAPLMTIGLVTVMCLPALVFAADPAVHPTVAGAGGHASAAAVQAAQPQILRVVLGLALAFGLAIAAAHPVVR